MINPIVEERFEYKGLPCVVLFIPWGYRTGYVGISPNNRYYNVDYMHIPVDCHGGLTYSERNLFGQDDKDTWWIGFDCGHYCDGYDTDKQIEYYKDDERVMGIVESNNSYSRLIGMVNNFKTFDFVKKECMGIVEQLLEMEETNGR